MRRSVGRGTLGNIGQQAISDTAFSFKSGSPRPKKYFIRKKGSTGCPLSPTPTIRCHAVSNKKIFNVSSSLPGVNEAHK